MTQLKKNPYIDKEVLTKSIYLLNSVSQQNHAKVPIVIKSVCKYSYTPSVDSWWNVIDSGLRAGYAVKSSSCVYH